MRILIAGGGFVGMYAARRLEHVLEESEHELVLISDDNFLTYQPFLPEATAGTLEPRHVVVPLRQVLEWTRLVVGEVQTLDVGERTASIRTMAGDERDLAWDQVVLGAGSVSRVLPVPGLAEHACGFKTVEEAIHLRNQVLTRLEEAVAASDEAERRARLTFVFVGGGYTGVEALAELESLARSALADYPELRRDEMRWVLVEAADTIMPEIDARLARYAERQLSSRQIEIRLSTTLESLRDGEVVLSDGDRFPARTVVWTAGVRAAPLAAESGLPVDDRGRIRTDAYLRALDDDGNPILSVWAAGDAAAVPDVTTGRDCPPTAQHALRQARCLADNLAAMAADRPLTPFRYRNLGQLVSLGRYRGVASVLGVHLRGFPAWWLHRTYHLLAMPTAGRRVRIALDWTIALLFPRDTTSLGSLRDPRRAFRRASGSTG